MICDNEKSFRAIKAIIKKANQEGDLEQVLYYTEGLSHVAIVSWGKFNGSYAYPKWVKDHAKELTEMRAERKRFSFNYRAGTSG